MRGSPVDPIGINVDIDITIHSRLVELAGHDLTGLISTGVCSGHRGIVLVKQPRSYLALVGHSKAALVE